MTSIDNSTKGEARSIISSLGCFAGIFWILYHLNVFINYDGLPSLTKIYIMGFEGFVSLILGWEIGKELDKWSDRRTLNSYKKAFDNLPTDNMTISEGKHEHDHQCPSCKKEYDCYLRNEYDECPLAYYEPCLDCKLKRVVNDPIIRTGYHPEKKMILVADKTSKESI